MDVIVVNRSFIPAVAEHQGMFIGSHQEGWHYYEDNGRIGEGRAKNYFERSQGPSLSTDTVRRMIEAEFDHAMWHGANAMQDEMMREATRDHMRKFYWGLANNCGTLVRNAVRRAGISMPFQVNPMAARLGQTGDLGEKRNAQLRSAGWRTFEEQFPAN